MVGRGGEWKAIFWNMAGLCNKDRDFWEGLKEWDVIVLSKTWIEGDGWNRWREKLPRGLIWGRHGAKKEGGMIMGIIKNIRGKGWWWRQKERV